MTAAPRLVAALDHLVLAAITLADGIEFVADTTGVVPQPGGKHVAMGTHNALLRLGPRVYLEIIAIDPDGLTPARPRWFDLDNIALQAELTERPPRIGATVRALQPYADLLDPESAQRVHTRSSTVPPPRPGWWKRLFG